MLFCRQFVFPVVLCGLLGFARDAVGQGAPKSKAPAATKATPQPEIDQDLFTRVYDVSELVLTAPNYPYGSSVFGDAGGTPLGAGSAGGGMGAAGGGMGAAGGGMGAASDGGSVLFGGMSSGYGSGPAMRMPGAGMSGRGSMMAGMGMGGGMEMMGGPSDGAGGMGMDPPGGGHVLGGGLGSTRAVRSPYRFDIDSLLKVVRSTISPESWDELGGPGTSQALGHLLVVRQTKAIHDEIGEFLMAIRNQVELRSVTIEAHWMFLTAAEARALEKKSEEEMLAKFANDETGYHGRVTCFDGQTVHIVSGRNRNVVTNLIPVVGQSAVGYQPNVNRVHDGAILQVTPMLYPNKTSAVIDVHSLVTQFVDAGEAKPATVQPGAGGPGTEAQVAAGVDRLHVLSHRIATTLRVPLNKPVLVGGMTFSQDAKTPPLYLVMIVRAEGE